MNVYSEKQNLQVKSDEDFGNEKICTTFCTVVQQVTAFIYYTETAPSLFYSPTRRLEVSFLARSKQF